MMVFIVMVDKKNGATEVNGVFSDHKKAYEWVDSLKGRQGVVDVWVTRRLVEDFKVV